MEGVIYLEFDRFFSPLLLHVWYLDHRKIIKKSIPLPPLGIEDILNVVPLICTRLVVN